MNFTFEEFSFLIFENLYLTVGLFSNKQYEKIIQENVNS